MYMYNDFTGHKTHNNVRGFALIYKSGWNLNVSKRYTQGKLI